MLASTDSTMTPPRPRSWGVRGWLVGATMVLLLAAFALYVDYRRTYPYGMSHCCDMNLRQALAQYASDHEGAFPTGERTPEASLSLLYSNVDWVRPDLLRGKIVPVGVVKQALQRDRRLAPDTCGWHYVEGLRVDDDPGLALFWDKVGLGHNGQRLPAPGHNVVFVDGDRRFIPESDWQAFVSEQARLLHERTNTLLRVDGTLELEGEQVRAQLRVVGDLLYGRVWRGWMSESDWLLANVGRKPQAGGVGLPLVTRAEVSEARAVVDSQAKSITFLLGKQECLFDGQTFRFVAP